MKALFAVILSFASVSAMACVSMGSNNRVCPGDRAMVQNAVGKVIGVNPMQRKVSIDFTGEISGHSGVGTYDLNDITVGKGCVQRYCVNQAAIVENAHGTIIGVNPLTQKITINFTGGRSGHVGIDTYNLERVLRANGCYKYFCVGRMASVENASGKIIGFNAKADEVIIDFTGGLSGHSGIQSYKSERVTVGKGCVYGYCVGDTAIVENAVGTIIGLNPESKIATINFTGGRTGHVGLGTYSLERISIGEICIDFSDDQRSSTPADYDNYFGNEEE